MFLPSCCTSTNIKNVLLKPIPCMCLGTFASVLSCMLSDDALLHVEHLTYHGCVLP